MVPAKPGKAVIAGARQICDPRIEDLVRAGEVRVALFPPQYSKDRETGELRGVWVEIARALAARMGIEPVLMEYPTPREAVDCLNAGACDVGFLGFDPSRTAQVGGFSPPFIQVDYTYLVPAGSTIRGVADADRPGIRVAAVRDHASTLALSRMLKQAEQVGADTPDIAFELLRTGRVDAWASIRPALLEYCARLPGSQVLKDHYGANLPAMVVPKGKTAARLAYISEFIEAAKSSGLVQRAIERAGQVGYRVVP